MKFMLNVMEDVKRGQLVHMVNWNLCIMRPGIVNPIGVAARDIKAGELIDYDAKGNTKDILTNTFESTSTKT